MDELLPDERKSTKITLVGKVPDNVLLESLKLNLQNPGCLSIVRGNERGNVVIALGGHWSQRVVALAAGIPICCVEVESLEALSCSE